MNMDTDSMIQMYRDESLLEPAVVSVLNLQGQFRGFGLRWFLFKQMKDRKSEGDTAVMLTGLCTYGQHIHTAVLFPGGEITSVKQASHTSI